jgi:hypothetical protein
MHTNWFLEREGDLGERPVPPPSMANTSASYAPHQELGGSRQPGRGRGRRLVHGCDDVRSVRNPMTKTEDPSQLLTQLDW